MASTAVADVINVPLPPAATAAAAAATLELFYSSPSGLERWFTCSWFCGVMETRGLLTLSSRPKILPSSYSRYQYQYLDCTQNRHHTDQRSRVTEFSRHRHKDEDCYPPRPDPAAAFSAPAATAPTVAALLCVDETVEAAAPEEPVVAPINEDLGAG